MKSAARALCVVSLGGCAYLNGVYNAQESDRAGERLALAGRDSAAAPHFADAAASAESVLAKFPRSRWASEALYLAGRGHAYAGDCAAAMPRLAAYLAAPADAASRARAELALGECFVATGEPARAREYLELVARYRERPIRERAALWAARAAVAEGDSTGARRALAAVPTGLGQWELASTSLAAGRVAQAESLLALRADAGDAPPGFVPALHALWAAGRERGVDSIVWRFDASRGRDRTKAALHLDAADLEMAATRDDDARRHLLRARAIAGDSTLERAAVLRLGLLDVRRATSVAEVDTVLALALGASRATAAVGRLRVSAALVRTLSQRVDPAGSSMFLAGEVARDSLGAMRLARSLFLRVADSPAAARLAPKALLAAALVAPDSADAYRARVRSSFAASPYVALLDGGDPSSVREYVDAERALADTWRRVALADTVAVAPAITGRSAGDTTSSRGARAAPALVTPPSP